MKLKIIIFLFVHCLLFTVFNIKSDFFSKIMNSYQNYKAHKLFDSINISKALDIYDSLVAKNPYDPVSLFNAGQSYLKLSDNDNAIKSFNKIKELHESKVINLDSLKLSDVNCQLGEALLNIKDYKNALDAYQNALSLNLKNEKARQRIELVKKLMQEEKNNKKNKEDQKDNKDKSKESNKDNKSEDLNDQEKNKEESEKQDGDEKADEKNSSGLDNKAGSKKDLEKSGEGLSQDKDNRDKSNKSNEEKEISGSDKQAESKKSENGLKKDESKKDSEKNGTSLSQNKDNKESKDQQKKEIAMISEENLEKLNEEEKYALSVIEGSDSMKYFTNSQINRVNGKRNGHNKKNW